MRFECADLDRVLREGDAAGMAAAIEHARDCASCREDLAWWRTISEQAPALRREWDSPDLWPGIAEILGAERRRRSSSWRHWAIAAAVVLLAVPSLWLLLRSRPGAAGERALLTEQALDEARVAETAYVRSIERLSVLAEQKLAADATPLAGSYREKLLVIDSAIAELKAQAQSNRLNAHLREELTALYRDKQQTLKEILTDETRRN